MFALPAAAFCSSRSGSGSNSNRSSEEGQCAWGNAFSPRRGCPSRTLACRRTASPAWVVSSFVPSQCAVAACPGKSMATGSGGLLLAGGRGIVERGLCKSSVGIGPDDDWIYQRRREDIRKEMPTHNLRQSHRSIFAQSSWTNSGAGPMFNHPHKHRSDLKKLQDVLATCLCSRQRIRIRKVAGFVPRSRYQQGGAPSLNI